MWAHVVWITQLEGGGGVSNNPPKLPNNIIVLHVLLDEIHELMYVMISSYALLLMEHWNLMWASVLWWPSLCSSIHSMMWVQKHCPYSHSSIRNVRPTRSLRLMIAIVDASSFEFCAGAGVSPWTSKVEEVSWKVFQSDLMTAGLFGGSRHIIFESRSHTEHIFKGCITLRVSSVRTLKVMKLPTFSLMPTHQLWHSLFMDGKGILSIW